MYECIKYTQVTEIPPPTISTIKYSHDYHSFRHDIIKNVIKSYTFRILLVFHQAVRYLV